MYARLTCQSVNGHRILIFEVLGTCCLEGCGEPSHISYTLGFSWARVTRSPDY